MSSITPFLSLNENTSVGDRKTVALENSQKWPAAARAVDESVRQGFCRSDDITIMGGVSIQTTEVFSPAEIGRAAGVSTRLAAELIASGEIPARCGPFIAAPDAVHAVKLLRRSVAQHHQAHHGLFEAGNGERPRRSVPLAASGAAHVTVFALLMFATALGGASPSVSVPMEFKPARMVFLAIPGPGGGGGGGGLRQRPPARKAQQLGTNRMRSPVPMTRSVKSEIKTVAPPQRPAPPEPVDRPADPPPPAKSPDPAPAVVAPVASIPADSAERPGVLTENAPASTSRGSGDGGGSGSGSGTGIGEGTGPGIGPGSGGGTGGGPYRPGSGITPPGLLREIKPDYTEEARRRGIEGEVVLEIVVRSDGTVGNIRVLRGLAAGLDQRAADAVRQWRFSPARRQGAPVDVLVEVSVEFRIR